MQREIFQKFVNKMGEHCENVLIGSEIDYRRVIAQSQRSMGQVSMKHFHLILSSICKYMRSITSNSLHECLNNSFIYECSMSWLFFSHSLLVLHIFDGYAIVVHHYIHNAVFYFIFKKLVF